MQALLQILLAYPLLLTLCVRLLAASPFLSAAGSAADLAVLTTLRTRVSLGRRFFRLFRFLDNFHAAYGLYVALPVAPATGGGVNKRVRAYRRRAAVEAYLDILSRSFNGMYLLLETLGLPDALAVPGLELWGSAGAARLHLEGQRFWFLALLCAVPAGVARLLGVFAHAAVPATGSGYGTGEQHQHHHHDHQHHHHHSHGEQNQSTGEKGEEEEWDLNRERERLREAARKHKEHRKAWRRRVAARSTVILRRIVADALDLLVPGSVLGWIAAQPGTASVAMLVSTTLTAAEVWERCGAEVRERHRT